MSAPRTEQLWGYVAATVSGVCAGLMYGISKQLIGHGLSALSVTFAEAAGGVLLLLPWYLVRFRRELWPRRTPWGWLLIFGATAVALFYFRTLGVALTGPTTTALVERFEIVLLVLYSYLFLNEKLAPVAWLGTVLLVLGMLAALDVHAAGAVVRVGGVGAALACATGIALNAVIIRLHLNHVRNELTALVNVVCQALVLWGLVSAAGDLPSLRAALGEPRQVLLMLLGGACIPAMLITYYYAMKRVPMWSCRLLNLVAPVAALLLDHFWLHALVTVGQLAGLGLVLAGAALVITSGMAPARGRYLEAGSETTDKLA